jgi:hypothetical protein
MKTTTLIIFATILLSGVGCNRPQTGPSTAERAHVVAAARAAVKEEARGRDIGILSTVWTNGQWRVIVVFAERDHAGRHLYSPGASATLFMNSDGKMTKYIEGR